MGCILCAVSFRGSSACFVPLITRDINCQRFPSCVVSQLHLLKYLKQKRHVLEAKHVGIFISWISKSKSICLSESSAGKGCDSQGQWLSSEMEVTEHTAWIKDLTYTLWRLCFGKHWFDFYIFSSVRRNDTNSPNLGYLLHLSISGIYGYHRGATEPRIHQAWQVTGLSFFPRSSNMSLAVSDLLQLEAEINSYLCCCLRRWERMLELVKVLPNKPCRFIKLEEKQQTDHHLTGLL